MCGRYAFYLSPEQLRKKLGLENLLNIPPRYNCAPMQDLPIVVKNRAGYGRWGFYPEWAERDGAATASKMINARSETVAEKPAFRESWGKARRCLVPANGFYEWARDDKTGEKQPYYISHTQEDVLYFAGLWSNMPRAEKREGNSSARVSFTILTKEADENLTHLHHRSPVMISQENAGAWFEGDKDMAVSLIEKSSTEVLEFHPVSNEVGKVANDHDGLIKGVEKRSSGLLL